MRGLVLITLIAASTPVLNAQKISSPTPPYAAPQPPGAGAGLPAIYRGRSGFPRHILYPLGIFSDSFYSDAVYSSGYPVAAQPPVIIVQSPPAAPISERTPVPAQPLMIELRDDHYVRISGDDTSGAQMIDQGDIHSAKVRRPGRTSSVPTTEAVAHDLSRVVLIFRDGHREETSAYTIADGILYAAGDYYTNGSWNRKIELSSLNLPETINSNRSRGVNFQLPTAPNEVIVRP